MGRALGLLLILCTAAAVAAPAEHGAAVEHVLVLVGVELIDGTAAPPLANRTLVIRGDTLTEIREDRPPDLPAEAFVLELPGHWVIPGLIDAHVHISHRERAVTEAYLEAALLGGITGMRDMGGDARRLASLQRDALLHEIAAPDIYYGAIIAGPTFFTDPRVLDISRGVTLGQAAWAQVATADTDFRLAAALAEGAGATALKIYSDVAPQLLAPIVEAGHALGLKAWGHAAIFPSRPSAVVAAGVDVISHAGMLMWETTATVPERYGPHRGIAPAAGAAEDPALHTLLADMATRGTILDATVFLNERHLAAAETDEERAYAQTYRDFASAAVAAAHRAGVQIAAGTDVLGAPDAPWPPLHDELRMLVEHCGLSPLQALRAATAIAAEALGASDRIGTLTPGMRADLVVLAADPTADIGNTRSVRFVVKAGRLYVRP